MKIEKIAIEKLIVDPANARKHNERNLQTIVGSLARFGQQKPIVIDKANVVRAGNGTLEAARSLGWTHLDCVRTPLDGSEATAYSIADNRSAELAEWDDDILAATLESLQADDEALLAVAGFSEEELAELIPEEPTELKTLNVQPPPKMAWVLLGIPTVRFGEISADVERLSAIVTICETTQNDG